MNHVAFVCCFLKFAEVNIWDFIGRFFFKQALAIVCTRNIQFIFDNLTGNIEASDTDQCLEFHFYLRGIGRIWLVLW